MSFVVMFAFTVPRGLKNKHLVFSKPFHPTFWHLIEAHKVQIIHAPSQNEITLFAPEHMDLETNPAHIFSFEN